MATKKVGKTLLDWPVGEKDGHENVEKVGEERRPSEDDPLGEVRHRDAEGEARGVDLLDPGLDVALVEAVADSPEKNRK